MAPGELGGANVNELLTTLNKAVRNGRVKTIETRSPRRACTIPAGAVKTAAHSMTGAMNTIRPSSVML